jgi:hypothetical protein
MRSADGPASRVIERTLDAGVAHRTARSWGRCPAMVWALNRPILPSAKCRTEENLLVGPQIHLSMCDRTSDGDDHARCAA